MPTLHAQSELVAELKAQGFDYLSDDRAGLFVDQAARELLLEHNWPFRLTELSESSPALDVYLGPIETVVGGDARTLQFTTREDLIEMVGFERLLTESGTSTHYYVEGSQSVRAFPGYTGGLLVVRHFSKRAWVTGGDLASGPSDTPTVPARYADMIVMLAKIRAHEDNDDYDQAQALRVRYDERLARMVNTELHQVADEPKLIKHYGEWA